jgi:hypothetical protein
VEVYLVLIKELEGLEAPKQRIINKLTNVGFLKNGIPSPRFI